jgi:hypothetical protein
MTTTKSHTHCLAAHATHIQSQSKSVLSVVKWTDWEMKNAPPHLYQ